MHRERGTTLIEAIATIAMVGLAVVMWSSLTAVAPRATERTEAHRGLLRAAEVALEQVRAGRVPLESGSVETPVRQRWPVRVTLDVRPAGSPGLWRVTAVARTEVRGDRLERRLVTQVWRTP